MNDASRTAPTNLCCIRLGAAIPIFLAQNCILSRMVSTCFVDVGVVNNRCNPVMMVRTSNPEQSMSICIHGCLAEGGITSLHPRC